MHINVKLNINPATGYRPAHL